ncbi:MAG: hypothetical protein R3E32_13045 [Chitinophagales bacterium]
MKHLSFKSILFVFTVLSSLHLSPLQAQCFDSPSGIAIDVTNNLIYWSEIGNQQIRSGNLDGTGTPTILFDFFDGVGEPRDVAIDVVNGDIFWTEINFPFDDDYIFIGPIQGSGTGAPNPLYSTTVDGLTAPNGIEVNPTTGELYWGEVINQAIVQGDNTASTFNPLFLNGDGVEGPRGLEIDIAGGKMYWADFSPPNPTGRIFEANIDGTGSPTPIYDLGPGTFPHGIAIDVANGLIYWTDVIHDEIIVGSLDGTATPTVLFDYDDGVFGPRHLALDAAGGKLYWTELEDGEIVFGNADGTGTVTSMFVKLWDGDGDGTTWGDAANWSDDTKPVAGDRVVIPIDADVTIDGGSEEALEVFLELGSSLTIDDGATLTIDNGFCLDGIKLKENASLTINGTLEILDTFDDGIDLTVHSLMTVGAAGIVTITDSVDDGIDLEGSAVVNMGMITIKGTYDAAISMISLDDVASTFSNQGTIVIDESADEDAYDGIVLSGSTFSNYNSIEINNVLNDGIHLDEDDDGITTRFTNYNGASILIENTGDDAMDIDNDSGDFLNNGSITVNTAVDAGVDLQSGASFTNDRNLTIDDVAIGIDQKGGKFTNNCTLTLTEVGLGIGIPNGVFENNSMIDITLAIASTDQAIYIDSELNNSTCGIINIFSQHQIEIAASGTLTNDGVLTTAFTGNNTHDGTFANNGQVRPSSYAFTGSAITGNAPVDGDVPAAAPLNPSVCSTGCPVTGVPTLSEWGLLILALSLMTLGTLYLMQPILEAKKQA